MINDTKKYSSGMRNFIDASRDLEKRVEGCSSEGHVQPNTSKNICEYCFQHLIYSTPITARILKCRPNSKSLHNLTIREIVEFSQKEVSGQMEWDFINGAEELANPLKD